MKKMKKAILLISAIFCITFFGCEKPKENGNSENENIVLNEDIVIGNLKNIYLLNEGGWGLNNASLTLIEKGKATNKYFTQKNNRGLGDLGNDMKLYGGKIYIAMNGSNTIEIVNASTGKSLKQIQLEEKAMPRQLAFDGGYAYISCHNKEILKIDTVSMSITARITISGSSPEGIAAQDGKLYVTNSGGQDFPNYDSTMSIIDIATFKEDEVVTIGLNPGEIISLGNEKLLISVVGNYGDIPSSLKIFNTETKSIEKIIDINVSDFIVYNQAIYGCNSGGASFVKYDLSTGQEDKTSYIKDQGKIKIPYGITIDELSGDIYVMDAVDYAGVKGTLYCFDKNGNSKFNIEIGIFPKKIVFIK